MVVRATSQRQFGWSCQRHPVTAKLDFAPISSRRGAPYGPQGAGLAGQLDEQNVPGFGMVEAIHNIRFDHRAILKGPFLRNFYQNAQMFPILGRLRRKM